MKKIIMAMVLVSCGQSSLHPPVGDFDLDSGETYQDASNDANSYTDAFACKPNETLCLAASDGGFVSVCVALTPNCHCNQVLPDGTHCSS
jgi:hypothetical protein